MFRIAHSIFVSLFVFSTIYGQEVGDQVLPKIGGKYMRSGAEADWPEYNFPIRIRHARDDRFFIAGGYVKKEHVVELSEAVEYYTQFLKDNSESANAFRYRGIALVIEEKFAAGVRDLNESIRINPNNKMAYFFIAEAHYRKGDLVEAVQNYDKAIELDRENATFFQKRGAAWYDLDGLEEAIEDNSEAIKLSPNWSTPYNGRGIAHMKKGDLQYAFEDFDRAIQLEPGYATAYMNRGLAYRSLTQFEKAMNELDTAIRLDPSKPTAWYNRGLVWRNIGNHQKAIADFDKAIKLDPDYAMFYLNRSSAHKSLGNYAKAEQDLVAAIKIRKDYAAAHNNLAWLLATCPDPKYRDGKRAVEYSTDACILLRWKNYSVLDTHAVANAEAGNFFEAIRWTKKAIELASQDSVDTTKYEDRLKLFEAGRPYREPK